MKLRVQRQEFNDALSVLSTVASSRSPKEILKCLRMEVKPDVLLMSATDLELSIRCAVSQVEVSEPGQTVVLADTIARIGRECPDEILNLETDETELHIRGAGSHFQIVTQDPAEFPPVPEFEGEADFTIEHQLLRRLVEWSILAAARESTRYAINGVLWEVDDKQLTSAATDGRRLAVAEGKLSSVGAAYDRSKSASTKNVPNAILPVKALTVFTRLNVDPNALVSVKVKSNQLFLSVGGAFLGTALVEGHFPKYREVVPQDCDRIATLKTSEFLAALKQAALLTNEESKGVRLSFSDGTLTISSRAPEQGEATVSLRAQFKHEPLEIGFNPVFLLDILRVVDTEEVTIALKEPNRPGLLRAGDGFLYVLMPVNLSSA